MIIFVFLFTYNYLVYKRICRVFSSFEILNILNDPGYLI